MLNESAATVVRETSQPLHLGLFGKHPCWTDHMEDCGLRTPSLLEFKRRLYYDGIGGRIDTGAWRELAADSRIEQFDHELLWTGATGMIFAVLWHSVDGGGRAAYPMVAAAHFLTPQLPTQVGPVFAALQQIARDCREAGQRDGIAAAQVRGIERLIEAARSLVPLSVQSRDRADRAAFVGHDSFGADGEGFTRLFYALTEHQNLTPANRNTFCYRVADGGAGTESLNLWQTLIGSQLVPGTPLLACRCCSQPWLDLMAGDFPPEQFFRLRAGTGEIPPVTEVPYTIPDEIKDQTRMVLESFLDTPESIPMLDACGSNGSGKSTLGGLLARLFRSKP